MWSIVLVGVAKRKLTGLQGNSGCRVIDYDNVLISQGPNIRKLIAVIEFLASDQCNASSFCAYFSFMTQPNTHLHGNAQLNSHRSPRRIVCRDLYKLCTSVEQLDAYDVAGRLVIAELPRTSLKFQSIS
jgi:hypothetical protein